MLFQEGLYLFVGFVIAMFCMGAMTESPWWRASLMTMALCLFLNAIIASIICRGQKQAFALGYMASSFFYLMALYAMLAIETLPLLLTQLLYGKIIIYCSTPPPEEHFYMVAGMFWAVACGYGGGIMASRWYRKRLKEQAKQQATTTLDVA